MYKNTHRKSITAFHCESIYINSQMLKSRKNFYLVFHSYFVANINIMNKYLLLIILACLTTTVFATTTSTVSRNIKIDGYVSNTLAPAGTNGINWEADEIYPGYQSVINWYVSWDDTYFYLGRKGFATPSSNALGSVIYIRAEYPGASYTPSPPVYDQVQPDLTNMGGIDFVAYIKSTYNGYRTYNGAWSGSNTLNPVFQNNVGNTDYMEVAIPWNTITNGKGKPSNVRLSMLQIDLGNSTCNPKPRPFIFSESPWGDGTGGSPTLGVNDGAPTSARQPGGCGLQTAASTRWWGCYPVIAGVGTNGYFAMAPDAGPKINICDNTTTATMNGNTPSATAVGTWTYLAASSDPGLSAPVITDPNDPSTTITGLNDIGKYVFSWSINYGGCPAVPSEMTIERWKSPTIANAGPSDSTCFPSTTYMLNGNQPLVGKGKWTVAAGTGKLNANDSSASNNVSNLGIGMNTFTWTISNGPACAVSSSTISVLVNTVPKVTTNPDSQVVCTPASASFSITATGSKLKYQWQLSKKQGMKGSYVNVPNVAPYSNTKTATLSIASPDTSMNGFYFRCFIVGSCLPSDTSAGAKLKVNTAASINGTLVNQTLCTGDRLVFHSKSGGTMLKYKWKKNNIYISNTLDSLVITSVTPSDSGSYFYEVSSSACGSVQTSTTAKLIVNSKPIVS
jgi:hypothetical protein